MSEAQKTMVATCDLRPTQNKSSSASYFNFSNTNNCERCSTQFDSDPFLDLLHSMCSAVPYPSQKMLWAGLLELYPVPEVVYVEFWV